MKSFDFKNEISSSKSYFNRALILSHYRKDLRIKGQSESRDVLFLKNAIEHLNSEMSVGEGGTTLRFLSLLVSRIPGAWKLKGSSRLFSRPQEELKSIFDQLGVSVDFQSDALEIVSKGWKPTNEIDLDLSKSSQFASALVLNAWDLPFDLNLQLSDTRVSDGYFTMTLDLVRKAGMKLIVEKDFIRIPAGQKILIESLIVEPDLSSAFVVASLAAGRGHCEISNFPFESLQPDLFFLELFKRMQVPFEVRGDCLIVDRATRMLPIQTSLRNAPDLFPVLCVLLTKAKGQSRIFDTPQLIYKESNRLQKTSELLTLMKVDHQVEQSGIIINSTGFHHHEFFNFDPDHDHRLAFAAGLAKSMGYRMKISNPQVVNKSFPGFWNLIGGGPG